MSYSNGLLPDQSYQTVQTVGYGQRGLPGIGFSLTVDGDYNIQNKKLTNTKSGTEKNDVVIKSQLDLSTSLLDGARSGDVTNNKAVIYSNTGSVHAQSFYLKDTPDDVGNSDEIRIMTEYQSYDNIHLYIPNLHNFDGFGGRPKSEMLVTSVDQTVTGKKIFENIEVHDPTSNNQAANKSYADTKLSLTGGTMTGDLILPHDSYPVSGNTNKTISYESQREIFLSRQESFPMQADINMNNNFIQNIATPTSSHQVTNKGYCDYNFLNRQKGGVLMGPLSMNRNDLTGIPDTPKFGYSAVNKNYVDGEISKIPGTDTSPFLKIDGSRAMTGILNMNTHKISNVVNPEFDTDVVNKQYLENKLIESHLQPSGPSNIFHFLMNDTSKFSSIREIIIGSFSDVEKVTHRLNKKALSILLQNDLQTVSYSARLGLDMTSLSVGDYTLVMEFYWPEKFNIYTYADSTPTNIVDEQNIKNFSNYQKLYLQFTKKNTNSPNNLIMEIRGELSTSNQQTGYLIFYGTKGTHYSITNDFYDQYIMSDIFIYNGNMEMQTKIDMNNNKIIKLSNGTDPDDAVNKGQLDSVSVHTNNQTYREIFNEFYDLVETSRFNVNTNSNGLVILGVKPNLFFQSNRLITNYDRSSGIQLSNSYINLGDDVDQNSSYTIFISLYFSDDIKIQFSDINHNIFYPSFSITYNNSRLRINRSLYLRHHIIIPADFKNKQVMLWVCHNAPNNLYRFAISNHTSFIQSITSPASFKTKILRIIYNNHVKKIGWVKKFININSLDHHRIMLEELREGSFFR